MGRILTRQQRLQGGVIPPAQPQSIVAPVTGWNTRDALDAMDPTDAIDLNNWFPDAGGCIMRNGYASFATGVSSSAVKTLAEFNFAGTHKFIACGGGKFYDITAGGAAGAALASGFTSDAWQFVAFNSRLIYVNGADTLQIYDGSTVAAGTFTGVTQSTLNNVCEYQGRLFFSQNNMPGFWYAALHSISGALSYFDLSLVAPFGGVLVAMTTFSHDGGNGVQDYIAFCMSSGDVLMYFGNDPGDATAWSLIGRYHISPPVNARAVCRYGAESYITSFDDHMPLQQQLVALKLGALPPRSKIAPSVQAAVAANPTGFGWQALYYPAGRRVLFNIPSPNGTQFVQHVFNTATQAWCYFTNMNAYCWGLFGNALYFGGAGGVVYQADTGGTDASVNITADGQGAWTAMPGSMRRRVTAVRPLIQSVGIPSITFGVGFDYGDTTAAAVNDVSISGSPWDTSPWDTSPWSPEQTIDTHWRTAGGTGQAISFRLRASSNQQVKWLRNDFRVEQGTNL